MRSKWKIWLIQHFCPPAVLAKPETRDKWSLAGGEVRVHNPGYASGNGLQTKIYLDLSICGTSSCNLFIEIVWPTALTAIHALPYKPCRLPSMPCQIRAGNRCHIQYFNLTYSTYIDTTTRWGQYPESIYFIYQ